MDPSRLTPLQIAMQSKKIKHQQMKDQEAKTRQDISNRNQTNNGTGYRSLHDLMRSPFYKDTAKVLSNNRKKEYLQRHFNDTIDNLSNDKLDDFVKKF